MRPDKRPLPTERQKCPLRPALLAGRPPSTSFRSHQLQVEQHLQVLLAKFPLKPPDLIRRILQQLDNDLEMAEQVLRDDQAQAVDDQNEFASQLAQKIIQNLPREADQARAFLRELLSQERLDKQKRKEEERLRGQVRENKLLKRAFMRLFAKEESLCRQITRLEEQLRESEAMNSLLGAQLQQMQQSY